MHADPVDERARLETLADYQFGAGAGAVVFAGPLAIARTTSGRPRQVYARPEAPDDAPATVDAGAVDLDRSTLRRLVTLGTDGRFTLGLAAGRRLHRHRRRVDTTDSQTAGAATRADDEDDGCHGVDAAVSERPVDDHAGSPPGYRVAVGSESVPYVRDGANAFAKFVRAVDDAVRPGDEVLIVNEGTLIGVGRAELPAVAMRAFTTGVAVSTREGAPAPATAAPSDPDSDGAVGDRDTDADADTDATEE